MSKKDAQKIKEKRSVFYASFLMKVIDNLIAIVYNGIIKREEITKMEDLKKRIDEVVAELDKEESKKWYFWDNKKRAALIEELTDSLDRYAGVK